MDYRKAIEGLSHIHRSNTLKRVARAAKPRTFEPIVIDV